MANFKTIHTTAGLTAMAAAEASDVPINLTQMAVGDGNGNAVTPTESQTGLVRELFRAAVNRVFQDPVIPNKFTAELVIPATTGGFVLREVGIFEDNGTMFAVGNLPDTYKPMLSEGAYADTVVRLEFLVTNADVVTLQIDPNVAVATQTWISNNITAPLLIPGGTTGQVLTKDTNADGDFSWQDPGTAAVVVDVIEERQTLAALQTAVILAVVTTRGLAVYIEGVRIPEGTGTGEWQPDVADPDTTLVLGQSYPAGTKILLVQNEPTGAVPFPLIRDQNLADVPDKAVARTNLNIYSREESDLKTPPGMVAHFARTTAPTGWLKANGSAISRTAYAALFAAVGTTFGTGDGFTTFNLPDLRGEFIRGWDDGRGADPSRGMGSAQSGAFAGHTHTGATDTHAGHTHAGSTDSQGSHAHTGSTNTAGDHNHVHQAAYHTAIAYGSAGGFGNYGGGTPDDGASLLYTSTAGGHAHSVSTNTAGSHTHNVSTTTSGSHAHGLTTNSTGDTETRPRNLALLACIKF